MDLTRLPANLPEPIDDGACDHLQALDVPALEFRSTAGGHRSLVDVPSRSLVLFVYPQTGGPGVDIPDDWDQIPGARGCTPQSCAFRDHYAELSALEATVYGLSSQPLYQQREFVERMHIPFPLLNDGARRLTDAPLRLPTFTVREQVLYKRVTLVAEHGRITKVFYPVFPSDENASNVLEYLRAVASAPAPAP